MRGQPRRGANLDCPAAPADENHAMVSAALESTALATSSDAAEVNVTSRDGRDNESFVTTDSAAAPLSHRAVDALRQSPVVEMHRSSSGRNLRLKHLSLADGALLSAPNALTPRAPSGRRPESRQRLYSADCNSNNNGASNNESLLPRSSSFSIAVRALKDHERSRSATDPDCLEGLCEKPEHLSRCSDDDDQQREDSSDESEEPNWDAHDRVSHNNSECYSQDGAAQAARVEEKAVTNFGLWGKAAKNKRMPDAIIFSGSSAEETNPRRSRSSSTSSSSSKFLPVEPKSNASSDLVGIPTASEMVSQLHVTHPHLAALSALDIPKSMSLTRSTSPRISRPGFSSLPDTSLRRATTEQRSNQLAEAETEANATIPVRSHQDIHPADCARCHLPASDGYHPPRYQRLGEVVRYRDPECYANSIHVLGANVLVNEQGVSKLADFGCSKQIPQMLTTSLEESLRSIRGSIPWMAPEVVKQIGHGYKADIWSIGATVIEMATAKHPWPHCHNGLAAMYTIAMATAPPPLPEQLSPEAKSFLRRCFCIDQEGMALAFSC
ncbi:unnamed protein product [Phytophthora fragariaefolia]|uniref:Unnamed protein product n=1 Tax=Phytophthora fragariaefolia TaxID=1490495 RepID=A0A9W6XPH4_9STRA|nr:unnamed protein product [Phytophthora fragariaefolia]